MCSNGEKRIVSETFYDFTLTRRPECAQKAGEETRHKSSQHRSKTMKSQWLAFARNSMIQHAKKSFNSM